MSNRLNDSLNLMVKAVNKIKKHALQSRLPKQMYNDNDEVFDNLILHTQARWLLKGNQFLAVFSLVIDFFFEKDSILADNPVKKRLVW